MAEDLNTLFEEAETIGAPETAPVEDLSQAFEVAEVLPVERPIPAWNPVEIHPEIKDDEDDIKASQAYGVFYNVDPFAAFVDREELETAQAKLSRKDMAAHVKSILRPVPALAAAGVLEAGAGAAGFLGAEETAARWRRDVEIVERQIMKEEPLERGSWSEATRNAFISMYTQAPAYSVGLLMNANALALTLMGTQTGLQKGSQLMESGFDKATSFAGAVVSGTSEALTELIPFGAFTDIIKKSPGVGKSLTKLFLGEQVGEQINTVVDSTIDKLTITPDMGWDEYLDRVEMTAKATIIQTALMGAGASATRRVIETGSTKEAVETMPEDVKETFDTAKDAAKDKGADDLKATVEALNVVEQTPEGKEHLEKVGAEPIPSVEDVFEKITQEDLTEEQLGEFLDEFAGGREAIEEEIVSAPVADIKKQLIDTGMSEAEASTNAALFDGFRVLAQRAGVSTEDLIARYLPQITREGVAPAEAVAEVTDVERAAIAGNQFLADRLTTEEQLSNVNQLQATRDDINQTLTEQREDLEDNEIAQMNEAVQFIDQRLGTLREAPTIAAEEQEAVVGDGGPRGRIRIAPEGISVELLAGADQSTFAHETGHLYLRMMADLSTLETASPQLKQDFETLKKWMNYDESQERLTVDQQEQFARGFEAYLMEGKAPTPALQRAFENFKQWLKEIYQSLLDLNVQLTDDVRGVMDRILAEEGVEVAEPGEVAIPAAEAEALEQAPLEDQRKKDLTATQNEDIFNIEESKRRVDNELYIHDRLPTEISSRESKGRFKEAATIARRSLEAVPEADAGPINVNRDVSGRRSEFAAIRAAEAQALKSWAEKNNLINKNIENVVNAKKGDLAGGEENNVFFSKKNNAWLKANKLTTAPTFNELFNRIALHNNEFPDAPYKFQGLATVRGELAPVFSQEHFADDPGITDAKKVEMAAAHLVERGFEKNPANDRQWIKGDIIVQDILPKNISVTDGKVFIFDPIIFLDPATKSDRVIGESIAQEAEDIGEDVDLEGLGIEGLEFLEQPKAKKPRKKAVKTRVREVTGQVKDPEIKKLREEFVAVAKASREAFKEGKNLGAVKEAQKLKRILARARKVRQTRDYFKLTDAELKSISRKNPLLLSQWEFKQYLDNVRVQAAYIEEKSLAKANLMRTIYEKDLKKVDNYRRALGLPVVSKMTINQLEKFTEALEPFHDGDVFLSERQLEVVDRTDLEGIKTWREAKEALAKETGVPIEDLETIKVTEWDEYKWDTALAESNPFYRMLITETSRKLLEAEASFHNIETEVFRLARASEKSRNRTFVEKAIPQDPQIMAYIESPIDEREEIAETMTAEQLDYAHFIESYFQVALEYLIKTKSLSRGRQNYFVHMRKSFLENVKDNGLIKAFKGVFKSYQEDEATFNILDDDTGNILPLEKFFQFSLRRTGGVDPTTNVTKSFLAYAQMLEKKKSLDELIPKMDLYAQSITPQVYTPRGLEVDRSIKQFVNKFINNKKGRRIRWISKQGSTVDVATRGIRTFTTVIDLGFNIPSGIAAFVGEQATNFQMLGMRGYTKGTARIKTKKGKAILDKYEAFVGRSAWEEFTAPGKEITERLADGLFGLFHEASVLANKQFLLGAITQKEYDSGEITSERLAILRTEMGRFRVVPGAKSLVGSTAAGSAMIQYKTWAAPIIRTLSKDATTLVRDLAKKPAGEALTTKEAREIYRFIGLTTTAVIVGSFAAADDDDESFTGQLLKRVYRESMTLLQGVDPTLWLATPRLMGFITQLGKNLKAIATLEEYKTKSGLKGIDGLHRQFMPRAIRQFDNKQEVKGR
jgi:hypothetical protein